MELMLTLINIKGSLVLLKKQNTIEILNILIPILSVRNHLIYFFI